MTFSERLRVDPDRETQSTEPCCAKLDGGWLPATTASDMAMLEVM